MVADISYPSIRRVVAFQPSVAMAVAVAQTMSVSVQVDVVDEL